MRKIRLWLKVALLCVCLISALSISKSTLKFVNTSNSIAATGAIFLDGRFECSGEEIGDLPDGDGAFLTARHCATNLDTNEVHPHLMVTFSANEDGPLYRAEPMAISLTEDLALLRIHNGAGLPKVAIEDDRKLAENSSIYNVSFPLGMGKSLFHGEYMQSGFAHQAPNLSQNYPVWAYAMPMNMTVAHGSSGSGVYDSKTGKLIGITVGSFQEGTYNIAMPSHRIMFFLSDLKDNTVDKFMVYNPVKAAPLDLFEQFMCKILGCPTNQ